MGIRADGKALKIDLQVTRGGQKVRHRETFHGTPEDAEVRHAVIKAALLGGQPVPELEGKSPGAVLTLGEALDNMMRIRWQNARNVRQMRSNIGLALEFFGEETPLADITTDRVDEYIAAILKLGRTPATVGQRLNPLSVACNYYFRRGKIPALPVFDKPSVRGNERTRLLSDEERVDIIRHFEEDYDLVPGHGKTGKPGGRDWADFFILLQDTGARASELRRVRHQDLRGDILAILFSKTDNPRHLPLTERALEAFQRQALRHPDENPLEWATERRIASAWDWIRDVMSRPKGSDKEFIPYLMRHDCATRLYALTRDLMLVRDWMGHKDIKMTLRYAKLFPSELERARDMLDGGGSRRLRAVT